LGRPGPTQPRSPRGGGAGHGRATDRTPQQWHGKGQRAHGSRNVETTGVSPLSPRTSRSNESNPYPDPGRFGPASGGYPVQISIKGPSRVGTVTLPVGCMAPKRLVLVVVRGTYGYEETAAGVGKGFGRSVYLLDNGAVQHPGTRAASDSSLTRRSPYPQVGSVCICRAAALSSVMSINCHTLRVYTILYLS
jgi:hypothetical protein